MSEFASQTSQAAQEEVSEVHATPDQDDEIGAEAADHDRSEAEGPADADRGQNLPGR